MGLVGLVLVQEDMALLEVAASSPKGFGERVSRKEVGRHKSEVEGCTIDLGREAERAGLQLVGQ